MNNCSRITNDPRRLPVSGRTALGRRIPDLADGYAAALGGWPGLSAVMCANVRRVAELTALAEQKRAEALALSCVCIVRRTGLCVRFSLRSTSASARSGTSCGVFARDGGPQGGRPPPLGNRPQGAIEPPARARTLAACQNRPTGPSGAKKLKVRAGGRP